MQLNQRPKVLDRSAIQRWFAERTTTLDRPLVIEKRDGSQTRVDQAFGSLLQLRVARPTATYEQAAIRLRNLAIQSEPSCLRARANDSHHRVELRQRFANGCRCAFGHLRRECQLLTQRLAVVAVQHRIASASNTGAEC